jgi:hypothetical protein
MTKSLFQFIIVFYKSFNIVYGELIISESDLFEINDEFNYCEDIGNPVIVDFQSLCKHKSIKDNYYPVEKKTCGEWRRIRMQERSYYSNYT